MFHAPQIRYVSRKLCNLNSPNGRAWSTGQATVPILVTTPQSTFNSVFARDSTCEMLNYLSNECGRGSGKIVGSLLGVNCLYVSYEILTSDQPFGVNLSTVLILSPASERRMPLDSSLSTLFLPLMHLSCGFHVPRYAVTQALGARRGTARSW